MKTVDLMMPVRPPAGWVLERSWGGIGCPGINKVTETYRIEGSGGYGEAEYPLGAPPGMRYARRFVEFSADRKVVAEYDEKF